MKDVIKLFKQIQTTSSLNEKKEIISANKDNELFTKCLRFLLDGNIVTGISDSKIRKVNPSTVASKATVKLNTFEEVIDYLEKNNTGRDEDIANVKGFIYDHYLEDDDEFYFYVQMVTKKYRLGADKKLVNKCIPGLIPEFNVMLGTPIEKCKIKENEWISLSKKMNGCRASLFENKIMTRQGKEYKGLDHIIDDLFYMGYENFFVDGELLYKNEEGLSDSEAFQKGTGIAMSKDGDKLQLKLVVFDVFPLEEFKSGKSKDTYRLRKNYLEKLKMDVAESHTENIEVVPLLYEGTDHSQIWKWLDYAEEHDWEGIMVNLDTPYECKRTKNLIKAKRFYDFDLRIIDCEEGTGRNKGRLGAFVVDYKGNKVNVGSGFSDEERNNFWANREELIGRVITVKYKEISKDKKTGLESLQFPIYCGLREEGKEVSYN